MKPVLMPTGNFGYRNASGASGGKGIKGRHGHKVKAIVFHVWNGLFTPATQSWFFNSTTAVSYNDLVLKDGTWIQLVDPNDPAWSNGGVRDPLWAGLIQTGAGRYSYINPNLYTHSIAREGYSNEMTPLQQVTLYDLAKLRAEQHGLALVQGSFIGHKDINSIDRSNCPGRGFNWDDFRDVVIHGKKKFNEYVVKRGDTLWGIARRHGITFEVLWQANPDVKNPDMIFPGQKLIIPIK